MQIKNPTHRWQLMFQGAWPTSVAFLGNRRIAAGNRLGRIVVWEMPEEGPSTARDVSDESPPDLAPVRCLDGHSNAISRLQATADGTTLISASLDHTICVWNVDAPATGTVGLVLDEQERKQRARGKSDRDTAAILEAPGVELETVSPEAVLAGHRDWVGSLGISRDESRVISGDVTCQVIVWNLAAFRSGQSETCPEVSRWRGHPWNWAVATAVSPDGQTALVSEYTYKRDDFDIPAAALKLWDASTGSEKRDLLKLQFPKLDATSSTYGAAQVWRKFVAGGLIAADFSPDGKLIAVGQGGETNTGEVHVFAAETGELLRTVSGHRYGVCDVRFSDDGQYVLSSGRDTTIRICKVSDGEEVAALGKERGGQFKDWIHALAISPDQKTVAGADIAGFVHVWQL